LQCADWDAKKQRVCPNAPASQQQNAILDKLYADALNAVNKAKFERLQITRDQLEIALSAKQATAMDFKAAAELFIQHHKQHSAARTAIAKRNAFASFEAFAPEIRSFNALTTQLFDDWTLFMQEKEGNTNNTTQKKINNMKGFIRWALERKLHTNFEILKYSAAGNQTENTPYLTQEELHKFAAADFGALTQLARARDIFVFACYTGLRFSDLAKLAWDHIKKDFYLDAEKRERVAYWFIDIKMMKTREDVEIPLSGAASAILDRYRKEKAATPLPRMQNQPLNRALKEAAKMAGICAPWREIRFRGAKRLETAGEKWRFLSTHSARHTFITLSEQRGMALTDIQRIVGHRKIEQTARYTRSDKEKRAQAMRKAWN
jgi:integrase